MLLASTNKPVYFNIETEAIELAFATRKDFNFSAWVKGKIRKELDCQKEQTEKLDTNGNQLKNDKQKPLVWKL
ncbi:hypothetical protein SDC9_147055 [bioreactor metagenome]|uniref:Uncharacterized protein n=1 Tax=bioreactor metagenome TaxID=1076179 RepID=A0A645EDD2_9ZZZZ